MTSSLDFQLLTDSAASLPTLGLVILNVTAPQVDWFTNPGDGVTTLVWSDCPAEGTDSRTTTELKSHIGTEPNADPAVGDADQDVDTLPSDVVADVNTDVPAMDMGAVEPSQSVVQLDDLGGMSAIEVHDVRAETAEAPPNVTMVIRLSAAGGKRRHLLSRSSDALDDVATPAKLVGVAQATPKPSKPSTATTSRVGVAGKSGCTAPPGAVKWQPSSSSVPSHPTGIEAGGGRVKTNPSLVTSNRGQK
jgi:hypothetical protein